MIDSVEDHGYVNFSSSNGKFLRITVIPGSNALSLKIVDLFSELKETERILPGVFKNKRVYFECDTHEDELIAVNSGLSELTIYGRTVNQEGGKLVVDIYSIVHIHLAAIIGNKLSRVHPLGFGS